MALVLPLSIFHGGADDLKNKQANVEKGEVGNLFKH